MLVVFAGLPGVGKTTLSRAVAQQAGATWLRVDAIESAIWRAGVDDDQPTGYAAYAVAYALADAHLELQADPGPHPAVTKLSCGATRENQISSEKPSATR
jgi:predicted ABC-type ATPase